MKVRNEHTLKIHNVKREAFLKMPAAHQRLFSIVSDEDESPTMVAENTAKAAIKKPELDERKSQTKKQQNEKGT